MSNLNNLFIGADSINKSIKWIKGRGAALDQKIHLTALSVANHAFIHNDAAVADNLYNAMPKGSRRNGLAEWFEKFSQLVVITKSEKDANPKLKDRVFKFVKTKAVNLEEGDKKPWYEFKKEKPAEVEFDLVAQWGRFIKMTQNAVDKKLKLGGGSEEEITKILSAIGLKVSTRPTTVDGFTAGIERLEMDLTELDEYLTEDQRTLWTTTMENVAVGMIGKPDAFDTLTELKDDAIQSKQAISAIAAINGGAEPENVEAEIVAETVAETTETAETIVEPETETVTETEAVTA